MKNAESRADEAKYSKTREQLGISDMRRASASRRKSLLAAGLLSVPVLMVFGVVYQEYARTPGLAAWNTGIEAAVLQDSETMAFHKAAGVRLIDSGFPSSPADSPDGKDDLQVAPGAPSSALQQIAQDGNMPPGAPAPLPAPDALSISGRQALIDTDQGGWIFRKDPQVRLAASPAVPGIRPRTTIKRSESRPAHDQARIVRPPAMPQRAVDAASTTSMTVNASPVPPIRPEDFAQIAKNTLNGAKGNASKAPGNSTTPNVSSHSPAAPAPARVARRANKRHAFRSRNNLIGVFGPPANRRALVQLKSGRYVKVQVGDLVDGWRVAAIERNELKYIKDGHSITLKLPRAF